MLGLITNLGVYSKKHWFKTAQSHRREGTGGYSKGSDRLTCTAQRSTVHGGKRRDSSEERVSSAITEFIQVIDHKPKYLIETQYYDITLGTLEWLGAASCLGHLAASYGCPVNKLFSIFHDNDFEVTKISLLSLWI